MIYKYQERFEKMISIITEKGAFLDDPSNQVEEGKWYFIHFDNPVKGDANPVMACGKLLEIDGASYTFLDKLMIEVDILEPTLNLSNVYFIPEWLIPTIIFYSEVRKVDS